MNTKNETLSMEAIAKRLVATRHAFRLNQGDFAQRANIAHNTYNQYEHAKKRPSIDNAIALCEAYDLTLDWIYRGDPSGLKYSLAAQLNLNTARLVS